MTKPILTTTMVGMIIIGTSVLVLAGATGDGAVNSPSSRLVEDAFDNRSNGITPVERFGNPNSADWRGDSLLLARTAEESADLPDLFITNAALDSSCDAPFDPANLTAVISNGGNSAAQNVEVRFFDFGKLIGETEIASIPAGESADITLKTPARPFDSRMIEAVVDPDNLIAEAYEKYNTVSFIVESDCSSDSPISDRLLTSEALPQRVCANWLFNIFGHADYDIAPDSVYAAKGSKVETAINWLQYHSVFSTDINGNFWETLVAPPTPGIYSLNITITDKTFINTNEYALEVVACPGVEYEPDLPPPSDAGGAAEEGSPFEIPPDYPLTLQPFTDVYIEAKDIHFSNEHPTVGEEIVIGIRFPSLFVRSPITDDSLPVNVYTFRPGTSKTMIHQETIDIIPFLGSNLYVDWTPEEEGIYIIEVEIDPTYLDDRMTNNTATRALIVGEASDGR